jgi:acetoin utilization deacetylase AcuC-like enzyme
MAVHRDVVQRVAIVDIDVHHGNGTEDIIRNLSPRKISSVTRTPAGVLHVSQDVYCPWRDEHDCSNVQFISVHGFGSRDDTEHHATFYPGTGAADENTSHQAWPCYTRALVAARLMCVQGMGGIVNVPIAGGLHTENWRLAMSQHVLPGEFVNHFSVYFFCHSLIFCSAPRFCAQHHLYQRGL